MKRCILSMLAFCALILATPSLLADTLLIKNAVYLNPANDRIEPLSVVIKDNLVNQVLRAATPNINATNVLDAKGAMLIPGMVDMHTHSWGNGSLRTNDGYQYIGHRGTANALLYAGVHGALDLFSDEDTVLNYRDSQFPDVRDEAWIFAAGPCFTATDGHCSMMGPTRIIDSPADVERHLNELALKKPNVLKVVLHGNEHLPTIDEATLAAFLKKAKALDIPSVVHVGSWEEVRMASKYGADAVTHLPWKPMPEDIPMLMRAMNTAMIPTVGLIAELFLLQHQTQLPEHTQVLTNTLVSEELLQQFPIAEKNERYQQWLEKEHKADALGNISESLIKLHEAGVEILPGSDAANEAIYQGVGLHRELAHLNLLGLPTEYLLRAVTDKAHQFLNLNWGLKTGAIANFALVNPRIMEDIHYSTDIKHVVLNGRVIERQPLLTYATPDWWQYTKLFLGFED